MVASVNQDFVTYVGDTVIPIFTVQNSLGQAVDISTASQIQWNCRLNNTESPAIIITKLKSAGQVTFVTNGVDGKFQVTIQPADTSQLSGFYIHEAILTDAVGNVTTVTVGRMQVGLEPTWSYNPAQLSSSPLYQVRQWIGDVLQGDQQMMYAEIRYWLSYHGGNVALAAYECCRAIAAKFSRQVDVVQGTLKTNYSERAKMYMTMAQSFK